MVGRPPRGRNRASPAEPRPSGQRILAGFHAVGARLRGDPASIDVLYFDVARRDGRMQQLLAQAAASQVRCVAADDQRLQGLSPDAPHQGVVAQTSGPAPTAQLEDLLDAVNPETFLLVLDGVTDPRNLGACMRTAAAAGVQAVIVPRDRAAAVTEVTAKAAAGATESLPLVTVTNLARAMKDIQDAGVWIVGAEGEAPRSLYDIDLTGPRAWALGAEGTGLRRLTRERCDELVHIPMAGGMESLNVSVATGVCLFETRRQRGLARVAPAA